MKRPTLQDFKKRLLKDPRSKALYDELDPEFALLGKMISARKAAGLTQEQVANKMKTKKANISRLEGSLIGPSPTLVTLQKYAEAVNCHLEINLIPDKLEREHSS